MIIGETVTDSPITPVGVEPDKPQRGPGGRRGGAALLVVGVIAGLLLGGLFGSVPEASETTVAEDEPVAAPPSFTTTTPATVPKPPRLATLVPGLVDAVVVTAPADLGGRQVWVWEATESAPGPRPLPGGEIRNDLSARWLAAITPSRFSIANALWVGDDSRMDPAATNVISAVWSRTRPAEVIWSEITSTAETVLVRARFLEQAQPERTAIARIPPGSYPVWWNDEGVVVTTTRELTFIDRNGNGTTQIEGRFLGGGVTQGVVVGTDGTAHFVDRDLAGNAAVPWGPDCTTVSFSPVAGDTVAVVCDGDEGSRLEVWWRREDGLFQLTVAVDGVDDILPAWTPDGRFVITAVPDRLRPRSDLLFVEAATGAKVQVPFRARILGLAVARG